MIRSTADLIQGWHTECAILDQKIACLRTGAEGMHMSPNQKEAVIRGWIETAAEFKSLIDEFSKCEAFPIAFHQTDRSEPEPVVRLRFRAESHVPCELANA